VIHAAIKSTRIAPPIRYFALPPDRLAPWFGPTASSAAVAAAARSWPLFSGGATPRSAF
jgi:hypothetical protein